jgi:uncharacterized protein YlbG (UPF0298 family)
LRKSKKKKNAFVVFVFLNKKKRVSAFHLHYFKKTLSFDVLFINVRSKTQKLEKLMETKEKERKKAKEFKNPKRGVFGFSEKVFTKKSKIQRGGSLDLPHC